MTPTGAPVPNPVRAPVPVARLAGPVTAGALASACGVGLLATSGWLITRASERPPVFALSIAIGAVQAFALGRGAFAYLHRIGVHSLALESLGRLRLALYDTLEPLVPGGLRGSGSGAVLAGFVSDAELVTEGLAKRVGAATDVTASVVAGSALAAVVEPVLGALLLLGAVIVTLAAVVSLRLGARSASSEAALRAELADVVVDTVQAAPELVAYGREDLLVTRLEEVRRRSMAAAWRRGLGSGLARAAATALAGGAVVVMVAVGLGLHGSGRLNGVLLAVAVFDALAVCAQLAGLPALLADAHTSQRAQQRLDRLTSRPVPAPEPVADASPAPGPLTARLEGAVVVADGTDVLRDVSLGAAPGARVALQGASGAGKTTVLHALVHFVEVARGAATLGGVDVRRMQRRGIARLVSWMADDTHVFAASLAENLRIARPSASDAQLDDALRRVGLGPWGQSLPDGLATPLGDGGRPVSAGERQRLGMARALLAGGWLVLMDEPTAHVDAASKTRLLAELLDVAADRTVVVVGHDPAVAAHVDAVVTLERGRVVARSAGHAPPLTR